MELDLSTKRVRDADSSSEDASIPETKRVRKVAPAGFRTLAVKTGFTQLVRLPRLKAWLENGVAAVSRISVEATRLAHLHVLSTLERDPSCSSLVINQTFFGQCIQLVCRKASEPFGADAESNNVALLDTYKTLYWPLASELEPVYRDSFQRFGEALARQLTTNAKVYVRLLSCMQQTNDTP